MRRRVVAVALLAAVLLVAAACKAEEPPPPVPPTPGEATGLDGAAILQEKCTVCHTLERIDAAEYDDVGWAQVIDRMIEKGADVSTDEAAALAEHLSLR
ncbi:MAG: hypothetical protein EG823_02730 [Actinobacteria bacterium]|nr:hypothetical protein [Actinomycetota bacterium]